MNLIETVALTEGLKMNLIETVALIKSQYASQVRPENPSEVSWLKGRIRNEVQIKIGYNLDPLRSTHWRYKYQVPSSAYHAELRDIEVKNIIVASKFNRAINNGDIEELLDLLNSSGYRQIKDRGDWRDLIEEKTGYDCHFCEDCGALEENDTMTWAYGGDRVICESCCSRNYHYSDYQDTYIHDDDEENEDNESKE